MVYINSQRELVFTPTLLIKKKKKKEKNPETVKMSIKMGQHGGISMQLTIIQQ